MIAFDSNNTFGLLQLFYISVKGLYKVRRDGRAGGVGASNFPSNGGKIW